jgi:hypothetical protein
MTERRLNSYLADERRRIEYEIADLQSRFIPDAHAIGLLQQQLEQLDAELERRLPPDTD